MGEQLFEVVISAVGEVRDADGNLVSSEPVEIRQNMTAAQIREAGITTEGELS